jgi:hypothetical protein
MDDYDRFVVVVLEKTELYGRKVDLQEDGLRFDPTAHFVPHCRLVGRLLQQNLDRFPRRVEIETRRLCHIVVDALVSESCLVEAALESNRIHSLVEICDETIERRLIGAQKKIVIGHGSPRESARLGEELANA